MASRFSQSSSRSSSLFAGYDAQTARQKSNSPAIGGYGIHPKKSDDVPTHNNNNSSKSLAFPAYPGASSYSGNGQSVEAGYRAATPNRKGQYSDAVLSELESQNDEQLEGMSAKVRMLKDLTSAIGDEIRDSTALAEKMNLSFENTRVRLRGTMNRMLRMAEKTGVGWRVWVGFFAAVILLFIYVWLF